MSNISKQAVLKAIKGSHGIVSRVAEKLGRDWVTARKYIDRWEETQEALEAEQERITDVAESRLIKALDNGDQWAVKFWLTTMGRKRGFITKSEIAGDINGKIEVEITER